MKKKKTPSIKDGSQLDHADQVVRFLAVTERCWTPVYEKGAWLDCKDTFLLIEKCAPCLAARYVKMYGKRS